MIHPNPADQEQVYSASQISITNINIEINSKDLFNTNITTPQEAYRQVSENFNANGQDVNTGSLLSYVRWANFYRIYAFDLSRQEIFESNPNAVQTIRIRGTASAAGTLMCILFKNKKTQISFSNPQNTRTIQIQSKLVLKDVYQCTNETF